MERYHQFEIIAFDLHKNPKKRQCQFCGLIQEFVDLTPAGWFTMEHTQPLTCKSMSELLIEIKLLRNELQQYKQFLPNLTNLLQLANLQH